MKRKPIKIDWDPLDEAFNSQSEDVACYLDLVTGHVVLEGEGEADDDDDEENYGRQAAPASPPRDDSTRLYVHPPTVAHKVEWMRVFLTLDLELDAAVIDELKQALTLDEPAPEIKAILRRNPEVSEAWFRYRGDRIHERIEKWLDENGVGVTEPPSWKS